jgi:Ca2+-transporting ATPase
MNKGLTTGQATDRLRMHGYNELASAQPKSLLTIGLEVVREPMFLLLISCGVLYMLLGEYREGAIMLFTICIIIFITFYQYQKTEKSLEALKRLSSPRALVLRNGIETRIPGTEVVPDDVILLHEGDRIPADAVLLEAWNFLVDESLLTGESVPVNKMVSSASEAAVDLLFSGTLVVQGKGIARVTATGLQTKFGQIGTSLQEIEQDETRLQKEMKVFIRNIFIAGVIISIGVVVAFYATRGDFIQSVLNGLASAMAILPEEFPVVLTVFLALGAWRLSNQKVLTRRPSAIETLGSATVLCSDKTGTITQNIMQVGALFCQDQLIFKNEFEQQRTRIADLLTAALYASSARSIDPMEKAISNSFHQIHLEYTSDSHLVKEFPLSKHLLAMSRVLREGNKEELSVYSKGAPEAIVGLCKFSEEEKQQTFDMVNQMAKKGFRVIAVASGNCSINFLPNHQEDFAFQFLGLVGLEDPIRPEVPKAVKECEEAGIKVIMITGDFPATASSIAKQIGLKAADYVITGPELKKMTESELREKIQRVQVFARIMPEQKLQLINTLKLNGEVVAMTGDGVNDAPALKAADIGVAMGKKGTDVAREASSLVLLDDNFASIVAAIRSGRKIYDNLQKAMSYILAIHTPIIGLALLPAFFTSLPILLMPLHIVFMELIIDPVCSIAFESEQEEVGIMKRPPRKPHELFFGWRRIAFSFFQGTLLLLVVVAVYLFSIAEGHTASEIRAIAFSSLIVGNLLLIITSLSKTRNIIAVLLEKNVAVLIIVVVAFVLLFLILTVPALQQIFSFQFPGFWHFMPAFAGASLMLIIFESYKYYASKLMK